MKDGLVGGADGLVEAGAGMVGGKRTDFTAVGGFGAGRGFWRTASLGLSGKGVAEGIEEGFGGEMAGDFSSGGAAHAIADDEGVVFGKSRAGVLIGVAHAATVGEHGEALRGWRFRRVRAGNS